MRYSWNWLCELVDVGSIHPEEAADRLTRRGLEVESITYAGAGLEDVVTARILEKVRHPDSDRLHLCQVDDGASVRSIVCGAQNMKVGDVVPLARAGAILPGGMQIQESTIRGYRSMGMLCSRQELGLLGDDGVGLWILGEDQAIGVGVALMLYRDDWILDIASPANRADCLSHLGIARELASHLRCDVALARVPAMPTEGLDVHVTLPIRGCALALFEDLSFCEVPSWVLARLEILGLKPRSNIEAVSLYVMLECGQPLSLYAAEDTVFELNGVEPTIVTDDTKRVIAEAIDRRIKPQERTEAAIRFERGTIPFAQVWALGRFQELVGLWSGKHVQALKGYVLAPSMKREPIAFQVATITEFLGLKVPLTGPVLKEYFERLGFLCTLEGESILVTPPWYRMDVTHFQDCAEEIFRVVGFEAVANTLPQPCYRHHRSAPVIEQVQNMMVALGFYETCTLAFCSHELLSLYGVDGVPVLNPLSEEHAVLSSDMVPLLVKQLLMNVNHHFGQSSPQVRLFEVRRIFTAEGEYEELAFVAYGTQYADALEMRPIDFFDIKHVMNEVLGLLHKSQHYGAEAPSYGHPGLSATFEGGAVGAIHPRILKTLKWKRVGQVWYGRVRLPAHVEEPVAHFVQWSEFPSIERDFSFMVPKGFVSERLVQAALALPYVVKCRIFDMYQREEEASLAVRVTFCDQTRSLQDKDIEASVAQFIQVSQSVLQLQLRD